MPSENVNNNKRINRFIKKIKDKAGNYFYFSVAYLYSLITIYDEGGSTICFSGDNTCKTAEGLRNTFGFFSTASTGGEKEKVLNNSQKKLKEEADQAKNFNIKYGFISEDDYNNLHENNDLLTYLMKRPGEMFNNLCPGANILSLNFVGKADRDVDGCFYVSPNKNNKKTCLLERLADLLGPEAKKFDFLSKYKRYIDSRPGEEKYLPVLLPEVRKRVSEPSNWRNVLEGAGIYEHHNELVEADGDSVIHGDFTDDGERITRNLLNLFTKGKCEFKDDESTDNKGKKKAFKISLSKVKDLFYEKIEASGFFDEWNKLINSQAEGLISCNEVCEKIKSFEQKILDIDFDGVKINHTDLIQAIGKTYEVLVGFDSKDNFLHDGTKDSSISYWMLEVLIDKHFSDFKIDITENGITGFSSGAEGKFDSIHYIQALAYAILVNVYKELLFAKEKSQAELDKKIIELSPKLKNLDVFLKAIINGGQDFDNLLEQAKKYKGTIFDFIKQKIVEICNNQLSDKDLKNIFSTQTILYRSLCDKDWAHVTQVNLNLEDKNKKVKDAFGNGFITKDGNFVIPFVNLYNASYQSLEKHVFTGQDIEENKLLWDNKAEKSIYFTIEKENLIKKTDQNNKNIVDLKKIISELGDDAVIEDVTMEEVDELIKRKSNLLYDSELNKPEIDNLSNKTLSTEKKVEAIINMFKKSPDGNKGFLENKTIKDMINENKTQKSIVETIDELAKEAKDIAKKKKIDKQDKKDLETKTEVLKNFIGNYIEFSNAPENQKEYFRKQLKNVTPYTITVLWVQIKNFFSGRLLSFDTAKKIKVAENTDYVFGKICNRKPNEIKNKGLDLT